MPTVITKTIKDSGGDFTSLSAAEAAEQKDLVAADEQIDFSCFKLAAADSQVTVDGWTTDATRFIRIFTTAPERHDGITPSTGYRIDGGAFTLDLRILEHNARVEGIAFIHTTDSNGPIVIDGAAGTLADVRVSACLMDESGHNFPSILVQNLNSGAVRIFNNIIYDRTDNSAIKLDSPAGLTCYVFQNSCLDGSFIEFGGDQIRVSGANTVIAKNNIVDSAGIDASNTCYGGTFDAASTNNLASDASAPGSNPKNSKNPTYVNEAGNDFHLADGDTDAKDQGADLSADANLAITDDIDGDSRPQGSAYDIGADEVLVATPTDGNARVIFLTGEI